MTKSTTRLAAICVALACLGGCAAEKAANPSFPLTTRDALRAQDAMRAAPVSLKRPVVVLGGWKDIGIGGPYLHERFKALTGDARIIDVSFGLAFSFDDCRDATIRAVEKAFPSADPNWTTEVDVVALSMGGLVARYSASEPEHPGATPPTKRLRIARLFTLCTPHRGAVMAQVPPIDETMVDMRAGSPFLARLDAQWQANHYEIVPYARLDDWIVGAANTAPPGQTAWWLECEPMHPGHLGAMNDQRIISDIARRLRGEQPFTLSPPAALPAS